MIGQGGWTAVDDEGPSEVDGLGGRGPCYLHMYLFTTSRVFKTTAPRTVDTEAQPLHAVFCFYLFRSRNLCHNKYTIAVRFL